MEIVCHPPPFLHRLGLFPLTRSQLVADYFFISNDYTPVLNVSVALDFQDRLVSFVNGDLGGWPIYGAGKRLFDITAEGFEEQAFAENLKERCDAINAVLLDPRNGV